MGNPYDDYVSLLLIYVMYYTMKSSMRNRCYFAEKSKNK